MKILFVNASPNKDGNTAHLANCNTKDMCKNTESYSKRVSKIAQWICE